MLVEWPRNDFVIKGGGGAHPKKPKKPVATPKSVNWHWFFLVFFWFFLNFQIGIGFFFLVFLVFLVFLALVLAKIRNWKLVFFVFFWFFLAFFGLFWQRPWPKFEIGNWFFGIFWFFWFFLVFFLVFLALVLAKIRNWKLVFFVFFCFFFGFFWFFWHRPWPTFEIGNWFFGIFWFFGFFWFFCVFLVFFGIFRYVNLGLEYHPKKTIKNQKKTKKKTVATPKLVNWLGFFGFFGVSTPQ